MISFTLIAILSTAVALVCAQVVVDPTTGRITCPVSAGSTSLAYCAGESLATNIIIRCEGTFGQPGNCNDNLAGIPPIGVKLFAPCYQSSPLAGDAACSYNGIAYPDNGSPFRIPSNVNTSTSSFTVISTRNISTSTLGTQTTSNVTALSTGNVSAVPTSHDSALSKPYVSYPLSFTTYISGVNLTIPATQIEIPSITVATSTEGPYLTNGVIHHGPVRESISNHIFTPVPVSYGPEEIPTTVAIDRSYILQSLERKGLPGVFKRDNTTSLQGTTGNTPAGAGGPVQTGASTPPFSGCSNINVAGTWVIGFSTLALTAVMV